MKARTLILRSIRHYWRTHLGVVLGVALAALVLTGALMVGDSVKATLRAQAEARVGRVGDALVCGERFVEWPTDAAKRAVGFDRMMRMDSDSAGVLMLQGTVERPDGAARANRAQVVGVDDAFWKLSPAGKVLAFGEVAAPQDTEVALNERLAGQLGVAVGSTINIRLEKPSAISKDAPLSGDEDALILIKARVAHVVGDADFGRFSLVSGQVPPATIFLPSGVLQRKLALGEKVNLVLNQYVPPQEPAAAPFTLNRLLESVGLRVRKRTASTRIMEDLRIIDANATRAGLLANFDLAVRELPAPGGFELRSSRVFLDSPVVAAAHEREKRAVDSLTYFVTGLTAGDGKDPKAKSTPYSMVTAIDAPSSGFVQAELAEDEIQITRWLAEDLGVEPGGQVTVQYFVMGERRELVEKSRTFTVLGPIIEMSEPQLNTSWMPDFPNVPDKDGLKSWKPGFDFKSERIRKKDEDYWAQYRGTPKAFVNLRVGKEMWGNRWGELTSIRYPAGTKREEVEWLATNIDPTALGFRVVPLREQALAATNAPVDFGQLFASFSFFLIVAAAVLTGLLFTFSIEQRATEAGLLLAVGWRVKSVRRLFLREGLYLALIGSVIGVAAASIYTRLVLSALSGVWSGATGGSQFLFEMSPATLGIGVASGVVVAYIAMWLASRRLFKREAASLLAGGGEEDVVKVSAAKSQRGVYVAAALVIGAVVLAVVARGNPGAFFGAGAMLLIGGLVFSRATLRRVATGTGVDTLPDLAARNTSRRAGRSIATIAVLASGVFMVVAVDSFRKGPLDDVTRKDSGTGGFALVGESSAPIYEDLNSQTGREKYVLDDDLMAGVHIVQMRVLEGDDASCLNLNRAMQPRLIGVNPEEMAKLNAFRFQAPSGPGLKIRPWMFLNTASEPDSKEPLYAAVDGNTLQWAMQKSVGDTIEYTDERGKPLKVQLKLVLSGSMLQGLVLISEKHFIEKFPNAAGYRFFFVDCPPAKAQAVREHLTKQLGDRGLELVPAGQRLAEFNAVENTYLSIFQVLGGLGMLLGSAGLGIVVARNVLERRREFGLLEAVGFRPPQLRGLVFSEHRWLIAGALVIGAASARLAVWPQLSQKGGAFPWGQIGMLFGGMALVGVVCAWVATRVALRGSQLEALRSE